MERKEAIEVTRRIMPSDKSMPLYEALQTLIPELRESEDERMCTRCIDLLRKVSAYSGEEYLGVEIADCIIWLQALIKKLKESLHITEICKEDADSFTDEDEGIRKAIRQALSLTPVSIFANNTITREQAVAWLEKQKEQKPAEWSDEDERIKSCICLALTDVNEQRFKGFGTTLKDCLAWVKDLHPSWKPSEQEKGALRTAIHILTDKRSFPKAAAQLQIILNAFEGKESRKDWKPSEEQIEALERTIRLANFGAEENRRRALESLHDQLKKLM